MAAKDFLSNQIKVEKIIGSNSTGPKLLVYPDGKSTNDTGGIDSSMLANVGSDTFLFVSGSIFGKDRGDANSVSVFGGDVVVSGTLYAERQVIEVDEVLPGYLYVSGSLAVTGSSIFNLNKTGDSDFIVKSLNKDNAIKVNSLENTIQFMSGGSPTSPDESKYTDTNYFVSGSIGSAHQPSIGPQIGNGDRGTSVFGGDVFVSGSMWARAFNVTNLSVDGDTINLKGYEENGSFLSRNVVEGFNSIALGTNNVIESKNSFVLGSKNNRIEGKDDFANSSIISSIGSTISGSNSSIILGGQNNEIKDFAAPSYVAFSNNVKVSRAEILALYSNDLIASGTVSETFVLGASNTVIGAPEDVTRFNHVLGRNNKIYGVNRSFILNFSDEETYKPENLDNPEPLTLVSGSNNSFVVSRGSDFISGSYSNVIFTENSDYTLVEDSFISGKENTLHNVKNSTIFENNINTTGSNYLTAIGGANSNYSDDSVDDLNDRLTKSGVNYLSSPGFNVSLGGDFSQISGSYNSLIGGAANKVTGSNSSIIGSIGSTISNSTGSVILGGVDNSTSANENFIIGTDNTSSGERSFLLGRNITNDSDDFYIIGNGQDSSNTSLVLSASKFEFGNLSKEKVYGADTSFFVSGSIGARSRFFAGNTNKDEYYGVSVFGGDVHISGSLTGGNFELTKLFFEGGEAKGVARALGNKDAFDLNFLTNNFNRVNIDGVSGSLTLGGMIPAGEEEHVQLHIRTGSDGSFDFNSSLDKSPASEFPLLISRNISQPSENQGTGKEVGLAFSSFPTLGISDEGLIDEPGAAITHRTTGFNAKGDLLFKTKTEVGQISLGAAGSLTTKLAITSAGEMLLGNDNPQGHYIDLRVTGSEWPLIQASGSTPSGRIISIGENKNDTKGLNQKDTIFNVYGFPGSKKLLQNSRLVSSFGGDVVVSGSLYVEAQPGDASSPGIDLDGSLLIKGDIESKEHNLDIKAPDGDIILNAEYDVIVEKDLVVKGNITGSHIKGDGLEISNVNKSSIWEVVGTDPVTGGTLLSPGDFIDGNTGVHMVDLFATIDESRIQGRPEIAYSPTTNTRLYDTYFEIEKDAIGQVKYKNSSTGVEGTKPIETERVESPEQLIISLK